MYKLKYFTESDTEKVVAFMKQYSFAVITGHGEYPVATHIPLEIIQKDDKMFFTGHIMKNSDHQRSFSENDKVLVVFNGPHCHISASWYSDPNVASTWNYMAVHAKGKISFGDEAFTRKLVEDLTNKYESPESISAFNKLPVEYIDRLLKSIVGFTIEVESFENVFKLSQNHDEATRKSIIEHLLQTGAHEEIRIAEEMQQRVHLPKQYK